MFYCIILHVKYLNNLYLQHGFNMLKDYRKNVLQHFCKCFILHVTTVSQVCGCDSASSI